ncbi:MAG: hypothetical protein EOO62_04000 [Hymenobacter sp.]|nr:MAG: hypothetical protein EOO62_04000 [Hymenobacter sp.]
MNQYFNSVRFGRLLRKHVAEHLASYAVSLAALFGIAVLVLSGANYMMTGSFQETEQAAFFTLLLLAAGAFFTSTIFRPLGQVRQAADFLTLPASHLEKYLVAWLLAGPLFVMFYIPLFYAADWLVLQVSATPNEPVQHLFNLFANKPVVTNWLLLAYPLVHGLALYGSIFFHRAQFVKTVGISFVGLVLLFVANKQAAAAILGVKLYQAIPFGAAIIDKGILNLPDTRLPWLPAVPLALAMLLWAAAYARLTEKQL